MDYLHLLSILLANMMFLIWIIVFVFLDNYNKEERDIYH